MLYIRFENFIIAYLVIAYHMNTEETKILNPAPQEEPKKKTVVENGKPMGTSGKVKYGAGGFAAGVVAGAAASAGASTLNSDKEEEPVAEAAVEVTEDVQSAEAVQTIAAEPAVQATAAAAEPARSAPNPEEALMATDEGIRIAQVDDDVSFSQAFADARAQVGPGGAFEWRGNVYNTYYEEEWNNMSAEQRAEFQSKVDYGDIAGEQSQSAASSTANVHHASVAPQEEVITGNTEMVDDDAEIMDVKVLGVEPVVDPQGNPMNAAVVEIDGEQALLLDVDNSGTMDIIMADENGDGQIAENEIYDFSDANVTVEDLQQHMYSDEQAQGYLASNDGMPDYMNDADISSLA